MGLLGSLLCLFGFFAVWFVVVVGFFFYIAKQSLILNSLRGCSYACFRIVVMTFFFFSLESIVQDVTDTSTILGKSCSDFFTLQ